MKALNNILPPDSYSSSAQLVVKSAVRVNVRVTGSAGIYYQLGKGWPDPAFNDDEAFLTPGYYSFERLCNAVQVRQAVAGGGARATVELMEAGEVPGG